MLSGPADTTLDRATEFTFLGQGWANVADEAWMGSSTKMVVLARFAQAQFTVYGGPDLRSVVGILAVVFPPANRAKFHGIRQRKRTRATAGTAK